MLRIDDNTFIDTSLITCAEYQLFLDDMRAQGKYFQPDHWTECQFPAGHAHNPLLGMRPSDALAFCTWLTGREQGGWGFRLPTPEEASTYPLPAEVADGLGYWAYAPSIKEKTFIWASASRPKVLSQESLQIEIDRDFNHARALNLDSVRSFPGLAIISDVTRDLGRVRGHVLDRVLHRALDRASPIPILAFTDLLGDLSHAFASVNTLSLDLGRVLDRVLDRTFDRTRDLDRALALARDLAIDRNLAMDRNLAVDLYVDLLTLEERIHGRLLPFEGIRIVKERKQEKS